MKLYTADAIKKQLHKLICQDCEESDVCSICDYRELIDNILDAPTIEAEPIVHGRWLDVLVVDDEGETDGVECSVCGYTDINVYWAKTYHRFCPNCGSKMDEVEDAKTG